MVDNGGYDYLRLPSFGKKFSEETSMDELRIPPEFVASNGADLPFDCRLVTARGTEWRVRLLRIASGCHFHVGWSEFRRHNRIVHDDFLTFTLVDVGKFHVKRYKMGSGCPPPSDLVDVDGEESEESYAADVDSSDDYEPPEMEVNTSDDEDFVSERGFVDIDGCPTFVLDLARTNIDRTIEIPFAFWHRHIRMAALDDPVYFNVDGETWMLKLGHSLTKIWVKRGWRRFKNGNNLVEGVRCHFKLIDANEVQF